MFVFRFGKRVTVFQFLIMQQLEQNGVEDTQPSTSSYSISSRGKQLYSFCHYKRVRTKLPSFHSCRIYYSWMSYEVVHL